MTGKGLGGALLAAGITALFLSTAAIRAAGEEPPLIEDIRVETGVEGKVGIFFRLNGFHVPTCFAITGSDPLFVCDFAGAGLDSGVNTKIATGSSIILRVRVGSHTEPSRKVRVVLDLDPERDHAIDQVFVEEKNEYVLIVQPE